MLKKNIFIIHSRSLYAIFDEVKALFDFNVFEFDEKDFMLNEYFKDSNHVFLSNSQNEINKIKFLDKNKIILLEDTPLSLKQIVEKINLLFLKINYQQKSEINVKDYILNLNSKTINKDNKKIKLTEKELEIILFLASKKTPQKISELQNKIWKYNEDLETHTVETHIYRLRKKIENEFNDKNFIKSDKAGYFFS